jgi:precorrin-3B synthase
MTAVAPVRRGACPSLSAPMETGDGLLVRLNPVDSSITPVQLAEIARAAGRFGNGMLEITARGSLQIRGLTDASARLLADFVDGLGIDVRTGVPVETAPLAGLDPQEIADPRPLAAAIRAGIARLELADRLGPKVSVVVDGGGRSMLDGVKADVRLTAEMQGGVLVWRLALAGNAAGARVIAMLAEAEARDAVVEHLSRLAGLGKWGRARDLLGNLEASSLVAPPSGLPAISPSRGEIAPIAHACSHTSASAATSQALALSARATLPISPPEGGPKDGRDRRLAPSGRTEGGATERDAAVLPFGTPIPLTDSGIALRVALPFGSVDAATLAHFADALASLDIAELRLCPERSLLILCISDTQFLAARGTALAAGLITDAADPRLAIVACAGAPACASGHYATKVLAEAVAREAPHLLPIGAKLHLSGCDKRCAEPSGPSVALIGREHGCAIVANGTSVPPALREYLQRWSSTSAHDRQAS